MKTKSNIFFLKAHIKNSITMLCVFVFFWGMSCENPPESETKTKKSTIPREKSKNSKAKAPKSDVLSEKLMTAAESRLPDAIYSIIAKRDSATPRETNKINKIMERVRQALEATPKIAAVRDTLIRNAVKENGDFAGLANAIIEGVRLTFPKMASLEHDVKMMADYLLTEEKEKRVVLGKERKSLLEEMKKDPKVFSDDLPRSFQEMTLGKSQIKSADFLGKPESEQFALLSKALESYINDNKVGDPYPTGTGFLGKFSLFELLYPISQSFIVTPYQRAVTETPFLTDGNWGAKFGEGNNLFNFLWNPSKNELEVSFTYKTVILNLADKTKIKQFKTNSTAVFSLDLGAVSFRHSYDVEGSPPKSFTSDVY